MDDRPVGEWKDSGYEIDLSEIVYCSVCGYSILDYLAPEICPNCQCIMINPYKLTNK